jgi:hypothetical protein
VTRASTRRGLEQHLLQQKVDMLEAGAARSRQQSEALRTQLATALQLALV